MRARRGGLLRAGLSVLPLVAVLSCEPTAVAVRGNGAFTADGGRVLQAEARFDTFSATEPWTDAPSATHWRAVFYDASPDLAAARVLTEFAATPSQVQSLLRAPLYWVDGEQVAVAVVEGRAVGYRMRSGTRVEYAVPADFLGDAFLSADWDLRSVAQVVAAVPSPDGARVAVHLRASYAADEADGERVTRYVHAVAFFSTPDGQHQRTVRLVDWQDSGEDLQLDVPAPSPGLEGALQPVPAYARVSLLWEKDGSGVTFVSRGTAENPDGGEPLVTALAVKVNADSGAMAHAAEVPAFPLATAGGPVSPGGQLLVTWSSPGRPNAAELRLHALGGGVSFNSPGTLPPADAGWAH